MQIDYANVVTAVAAVLALALSVYTFRRQRQTENSTYITLALTLERLSDDRLLAQTSLENRSVTIKKIDVVRLLICPQAERLESACNALIGNTPGLVEHLRDIGGIELPETLRDADRVLVPLHYYTRENEEVADEVLTYDAVVDISALTPGVEYAARLFLYGPKRLHRVVHRAFVR